MLRTLIHRVIARQERAMNVPLDYLRELADASLTAFFKLLLFMPLANHRRHLTREVFHLARIAATQADDCGTCVQIVVFLARRGGVDAAMLRTALNGERARLPEPLGDVLTYAGEVARGGGSPELREKLRARLGDAAFVELTLAIATARFFPAFKRGLGHAVACSTVRVEA